MALRCPSFRRFIAHANQSHVHLEPLATQWLLHPPHQRPTTPFHSLSLRYSARRFNQCVLSSVHCHLHTYSPPHHYIPYRLYSHNTASGDITLTTPLVKSYVEAIVASYKAAEQVLMESVRAEERTVASRTLHDARDVVDLYSQYQLQAAERDELNTIIAGGEDTEMVQMATSELETVMRELEEKESQILELLVPPQRADDHDVVVEVQAGVGGQEAMLFAEELFNMYQQFSAYRGWTFNVIQHDTSDIGGIRQATATVSGAEVYRWLKFEGGVHRVQRVPRTEKSGRIHTSTSTVSVMPQPTDIDITVEAKDLRIDVFKATGAGGQHVNKTESAVRLTHIPSGMVVECQQTRSQLKNRETALQVLRSRLYEKELEQQQSKFQAQRKVQIGNASRSEKIRTYNYNQDRITDHRIRGNRFNVEQFLKGKEALEDLLANLLDAMHKEILLETLEYGKIGKPTR